MENNEENTVITVENEGGKGNPNHKPAGSPDGGQFTSKNEAGSGVTEAKEASHEDDVGVFKLEKEEKINPLKQAMLEFAGRKKQLLTQQAVEYADSVQKNVSDEQKEFINGLSREQKLDYFANNEIAGYDNIRLKFASDEQLTALMYAEAVLNGPKQLEQQKILLEKGKEEINKKIEEELNAYNSNFISGVWKYDVPRPKDYKAKKENGTFDLKLEYYNNVLNGDYPLNEKMKATQNIKKLEQFEKDGLEYEQKKIEINAKYIDDLENIESALSVLAQKKNIFYNEDGSKTDLMKSAESFTDRFRDLNSAYSPARKNKAVWYKTFNSAYSHFSTNANKHWDEMNYYQKKVIQAYTGSGYSRFNKPLREIYHDKGGYSFDEEGLETFSEGVNNLTNAIEKCTWDEDIWVNRYISNHTKMFTLPGLNQKMSLESMTNGQLQSLVGTSFTDNGFVSAGAAKGTGYHTGDIVFNIYCPKGTKMAYVAPYSSASKQENEMILQRGYRYRITKVEHKNGHYYLDMEVILGSDASKPVGNDLKKLGNEYYYKPRGSSGEKYE